MTWLSLPARNVLRHLRRSLYAGVILSVSLAALGLFDGFTNFLHTAVREMVIYSSGSGHLQISTADSAAGDASEPGSALIDGDTAQVIDEMLRADPRVVVVAPKLGVTGLLSNGEKSVPFRAVGMRPQDRRAILGQAEGVIARMVAGELREAPMPPHGWSKPRMSRRLPGWRVSRFWASTARPSPMTPTAGVPTRPATGRCSPMRSGENGTWRSERWRSCGEPSAAMAAAGDIGGVRLVPGHEHRHGGGGRGAGAAVALQAGWPPRAVG